MAVRLCEFESHPPYFDPLAQSVEHNTFNVGVLGSNPKRITLFRGRLGHSKNNPKRMTSNPFCLQKIARLTFGAIAQMVEQRTENPCVPGSIPGGTTIILVSWMSGLVTGLQNQLQRFESATDLFYIGRLAQLVQSVCLTSRGSGVRIPQRPQVVAQQRLFISLILQ